MSSYLHNELWIICTNESSFCPRKIQIDVERRGKSTVKCLSQKYLLLTEVDTKINEDFKCISQWSHVPSAAFWGATLGGVASALGGAALVAAFIPGPGWIASAILIGFGALVGIAIAAFKSPALQCNKLLCNVKWSLPLQNVKFEKHLAITKKSYIQCPEGGTLLAFLSEESAKAAARSIASYNNAGLTLDTIASIIGGGLLGTGITGISAVIYAAPGFIGGLLIGNGIIEPLRGMESQFIRSEHNGNNEIYDNINKEEVDANNDLFNDLSNSNTLLMDSWAGGMFGAAIVRSRLGYTNAAGEHPALAWLMRSKWSPYSGFFQGTRGCTGTNNSKRHGRAMKDLKGGAFINIVLGVEPFISTWVTEEGRKNVCDYAQNDLENSISIVSCSQ